MKVTIEETNGGKWAVRLVNDQGAVTTAGVHVAKFRATKQADALRAKLGVADDGADD